MLKANVPDQTASFNDAVKKYVKAGNDLDSKKSAVDIICQILTASYTNAMAKEKVIEWLPATYGRLVSSTPLKLAFEVKAENAKICKKDSFVYLKIFTTQFEHLFLIDSCKNLNSTFSEVVLTVRRQQMEKLDIKKIAEASESKQCFILPIDDSVIVLQEAVQIQDSIMLKNTVTNEIMDQLYGKNTIASNPQSLPVGVPNYDVKYKSGSKLSLHELQKKAIKTCCSATGVVSIEAPYGTGKTVVGAHLAVTLAKTIKTPILVVSATNAAIARFAECLADMDGGDNLKAVRLVSENYSYFKGSLRDDYPSTSIDMSEILKSFERNRSIGSSDRQNLLLFNKCRDYVRRVTLLEKNYPSEGNQVTELNIKQFRDSAKTAATYSNAMLKLLLDVYQPNVILITVDYLLGLCKNPDFYKYIRDTEMIIVDESSQILEITFLVLMSKFQKARFRFFGDSKQLDPYTESSESPLCIPITQRFRRNNQSVEIMLTTTNRSHPALNELPNKLFYKNKLLSGADPNEKSDILKKFKFPNRETPTLFINDDNGIAEKSVSQSWSNKSEKDVCLQIVNHLKGKGIKSEHIGIICLYLEQKDLMETCLKDVEIRTVDSFQGREKEVIILLTTRTFGGISSFLKDKKRLNVALTRAKQALFIIGKSDYLQRNILWKTIINHHRQLTAFIQRKDMDKHFPTTTHRTDEVMETVQKLQNTLFISNRENAPMSTVNKTLAANMRQSEAKEVPLKRDYEVFSNKDVLFCDSNGYMWERFLALSHNLRKDYAEPDCFHLRSELNTLDCTYIIMTNRSYTRESRLRLERYLEKYHKVVIVAQRIDWLRSAYFCPLFQYIPSSRRFSIEDIIKLSEELKIVGYQGIVSFDLLTKQKQLIESLERDKIKRTAKNEQSGYLVPVILGLALFGFSMKLFF